MISKCKGSYSLLFCQIFSCFLLSKNVTQKEIRSIISEIFDNLFRFYCRSRVEYRKWWADGIRRKIRNIYALGQIESCPYDIVPQAFRLFLDKFSLTDNRFRVRSVYPYNINACRQSFHFANRIVAVYLNASYHLPHHVYNLDFRNYFGGCDV